MTTRPLPTIEWATDGVDIEEPIEEKRKRGWEAGEKPIPAAWFNWFQNRAYQWVTYLETVANELRETLAGVVLRSWRVLSSGVPSAETFTAVIWHPGVAKFLCLENGNYFMQSPTGTTWTDAANVGASNWASMAYGAAVNKVVAVAASGTVRVMSMSQDGVWVDRSVPAEANTAIWYSVAWSPSLNRFVAVGYAASGEYVMYSANGETWTAAIGAERNYWRGVCWSPKLAKFVAVADTGTNRVMHSSDGITWSVAGISGVPVSDWQSVCWSPELEKFIAVADAGAGHRIMTSVDGLAWSGVNSPEQIEFTRVVWVAELQRFIATAKTGTDRVIYSTNGTVWITDSGITGDTYWRDIAWSPTVGRLVLVAEGYSGGATSGKVAVTQ